ncbi:AMP-binding protein [Plantactinospora sp. WMMB334]|uniref:2OG-Fe(II)-dependent halogenase WelO5 family protein n=1 Tax=Plantactinospora sp. WMMB334 TaxID=3404119 RepID=UPI003B95DB32
MTIHERFRAQATRSPASTAMVHGERIVDYQTLDAASDAVAVTLARAGVTAGAYVPLVMPRSPELAATLLGILKIGACYAALDPAWPRARIAALADRLGAPLLLPLGATAPPGTPSRHLPDGDVALWAKRGVHPDRPVVDASSPATVFFTSGSTGVPKAVVSPHRATVDLLAGCRFAVLDERTTMPLAAPVPWDAFSLELWGPLLSGGTSVVVDEPYLDAASLRRVVGSAGVNTAWLGAALFHVLVEEDLDAFAGLRQVMIGGERVSPGHAARFLGRYPDVRLVNGYGPVECTIFATTHRITGADCADPAGVPIGRPVAETGVHVLAPDGHPCQPGERGEIHLEGPRLALDYLSELDGPAEVDGDSRFVERELAGRTRRLYRTGDLGHWSRSGLLYYDGRADRQVKIRGQRVAPEEVERALARLGGVGRCAVVSPRDETGRHVGLVAYYTTDGAEVDGGTLRAALAAELPGHLRPDRLVPRDALPMQPNGKLDLRALEQEAGRLLRRPAPEAGPLTSGGDVFAAVRHAYAAVLALPEIPDDVPFFQLGGTSLDAGRVCVRLGQHLGVEVPVSQLMRRPAARDLAAWLAAVAAGPTVPATTAGPPAQRVPLLPIQVEFLLANEMSADTAANCPFGWWVEGPLDEAALVLAVRDVHARHESLRARYLLDDPPVAVVEPGSGRDPLRVLPPTATEEEATPVVLTELERPLDLAAGEVWRVVLVHCTSTARTLLGMVVHHIAWDGSAELVLVDDLSRCYAARSAGREPDFPAPAPSLAEMYRAYRQPLGHAGLDEQRAFWRAELAGLAPLAFGDRPDPGAGASDAMDVWITPDDVASCDSQAAAAGTTRFAALFNAFAEGVATVTGARDVGIGVPVTKRRDQAGSGGVNCLIDIVCVRARPVPYDEPVAALRAAGERMRAALGAQDIAFGDVVRTVNPVRTERPPLYQAMFTLEPKNDPGLELTGCTARFFRLDPPIAMTELGNALWPQTDGGYRAHLVFRPDRVTRQTVADIGDAMLAAIRRGGRPAASIPDGAGLTGWRGPADYFRFVERTSFDPADVLRVLRGELAGVVFRRAYPAEAVARILDRFRTHPAAVRRDDDAVATYLGAYHYHKTTADYLAEAAATRAVVDEVLWFDGSPWRAFREELAAHLAGSGVTLRGAEHDGGRACLGVARSWEGRGDFALVPHEDGAQCAHPAQAGFEVQLVPDRQVCAVNLCLANEGGGRLVLWNVKPDGPGRQRFHTHLDGGPYPASALASIPSVTLDVTPGDLYVFNGGHVHAVTPSRGPRATASMLLGFRDDDTAVTWT